MNKKSPQKYYVPDLGQEIQVEQISSNQWVAHYPTGPERVSQRDMRDGKWEHRGRWESKNER